MDRPPVASPLIPLWYLHGGTHVRILTNFFKKHFFKNFWALSKGPRGSTPIPLLALRTLRFSPHLYTAILASRKRWIPTSNVTPTPIPTTSPPHHRLHPAESPAFAFYSFFQKTLFQNFLGFFPTAPGAQDPHFRIPLLALRTLGYFPASPPLFTPAAKRWSLTSNVQLLAYLF